jgi:hypothetical protein
VKNWERKAGRAARKRVFVGGIVALSGFLNQLQLLGEKKGNRADRCIVRKGRRTVIRRREIEAQMVNMDWL